MRSKALNWKRIVRNAGMISNGHYIEAVPLIKTNKQIPKSGNLFIFLTYLVYRYLTRNTPVCRQPVRRLCRKPESRYQSKKDHFSQMWIINKWNILQRLQFLKDSKALKKYFLSYTRLFANKWNFFSVIASLSLSIFVVNNHSISYIWFK